MKDHVQRQPDPNPFYPAHIPLSPSDIRLFSDEKTIEWDGGTRVGQDRIASQEKASFFLGCITP